MQLVHVLYSLTSAIISNQLPKNTYNVAMISYNNESLFLSIDYNLTMISLKREG